MSLITTQRTVFVLDVSGSMEGIKSQVLQLTANRFIEDSLDGAYVAIVLFDDEAWIQHEATQITERSTRNRLIASVPQMARGLTNIGKGLIMGLEALNNKKLVTENASIILITDGADNCSSGNYVDNVLPQLLSAKVIVTSIAIGNTADSNLDRLAKETGGKTYIASDYNKEMAVRVIETAIQETKASKEIAESLTISVCNEFLVIKQQSIAIQVIMEPDIGRNTNFTVGSHEIDKLSVSFTSPSGQNYDSTCPEFIKDHSRMRYQLKLLNSKSGVWTINFVRHSNHNLEATLTVNSQPKAANVLQMRVKLKNAEIDSKTPPLIIAELFKGKDVVMGADVVATIDKPDKTQTLLKLNNYNNIYINYFTDYCGPGRYNVSVMAKNENNICRFKNITGENSGGLFVPHFQRQIIAGCFKVESFMPSKPTNDLQLQEISLRESINTLTVNSNSFEQPTDTPRPLNARAVIAPLNTTNVNQQNIILKAERDQLWEIYLVTKKLINSSTIQETEKNSLMNALEKIDYHIQSTTIEEIEINRKQLEEIKSKLMLKEMQNISLLEFPDFPD